MNASSTPLTGDSYHLWVPIEDTNELLKSVEVDENGDFIVQGVMTSNEKDEEDDSITPEGMDCSYFLTKGWIKYEHGNNPNQFIGEPLEVRVGQFTHPTTQKSVKGIFVKGRLFAQRKLAQEAVQTIVDLQKSHTKRRMGWSIEGNVKERCRKTGKIIKSVLRNVVLTMNPINTTTWAELAKSFAKHHEVEINMEKAMDTEGMLEVTPQSLEGKKPKEDDQQRWIDLFRRFVRSSNLEKSVQAQHTAGDMGLVAYQYARHSGLDYDDACTFADYIVDRHDIIKSLAGRIGGERSMEDTKQENQNTLASLLDDDLDELRKSLEIEEDTEDELEKAVDTEGEEDEEEGSEGGSEDDDDDEYEEDEEVEKSAHSELHKSLSKDHGQAFEVSEWLSALADELGFGMEGIQKSLTHMTKQQTAIVKSLVNAGQVIQELSQKVEEQDAMIDTLQKSLNDVLERPTGRKSIVSQREAVTLTKSAETAPIPTTRSQVEDILLKSFEAGELDGKEVVRFNSGVAIENLNLPQGVRAKLGL